MRIVVGLALTVFIFTSSIAASQQIPPGKRVSFIGSFSNMEYTEEHQYGFEAELWKAGDIVIGHFLHSEGLAGDTPTGAIERVNYDPKSGSLSFQAKLSIGTHHCKEHNGVPSRDVYQFEGALKGKLLAGVVKKLDALHGNQLVGTEKVELKKTEIEGALKPEPAIYAEWEKESRRILNCRGPKW